ncbi:MAG: PTS sugar transporter subunit IIA [[Candidatus Thermochlorobacteriaceae] bacterium GBChlB]|nr:MAG: PTS sugar transporter subunit IIA [[Candidatus Thermochlorobacteriaceae] bacterium GBChlB]
MKLTDILSEKFIQLGLEAKSKNDLIEKMLMLVAPHPSIIDKTKLRSDVLKREKEMSTGIGKNVALPHAKTSAVSAPVLAVATLKKEIDFAAIDGEPVSLVFLLATPEQMLTQHLKLLSRISRVVSAETTREKMVKAATPEEVFALFVEEEKSFPEI